MLWKLAGENFIFLLEEFLRILSLSAVSCIVLVLMTMVEEAVQKVHRLYIQNVIDHVNARMCSTDLLSSMSVFDPRHLLDSEEELTDYGVQMIQTVIGFYESVQKAHFEGNEGVSQLDVVHEDTKAKWKLFRSHICTTQT